jgi:hypothetical protein
VTYSKGGDTKGGGHKDCAYGVAGKTFSTVAPSVQQRKHGHLERPPSQENAAGVKGKDFSR